MPTVSTLSHFSERAIVRSGGAGVTGIPHERVRRRRSQLLRASNLEKCADSFVGGCHGGGQRLESPVGADAQSSIHDPAPPNVGQFGEHRLEPAQCSGGG